MQGHDSCKQLELEQLIARTRAGQLAEPPSVALAASTSTPSPGPFNPSLAHFVFEAATGANLSAFTFDQ